MAVVFIEHALGASCDDAAEAHRRLQISEREHLQVSPVDSSERISLDCNARQAPLPALLDAEHSVKLKKSCCVACLITVKDWTAHALMMVIVYLWGCREASMVRRPCSMRR